LISQAWLVSEGKIRDHRDWGLAGISLATAVVVVGYATAIFGLHERLARGEGDRARAFLSTPFTAITLFAIFVAAAIACTHRPEWHKRLMIAGTVSLVNAAAARLFPSSSLDAEVDAAHGGYHGSVQTGALAADHRHRASVLR